MVLKEDKDGTWHLKTSKDNFSGTFTAVVKRMHIVHGVKLEQVELAIKDMIQLNHSEAEFGDLNKTYMFTRE